MSSPMQRGTVKSITFEIEYPDGSRKTSSVEAPETVALIVLDGSRVPAVDADTYDVSAEDWRLNPAMLLYKGDSTATVVREAADVGPQGGGGGLPFCTHNGCKL